MSGWLFMDPIIGPRRLDGNGCAPEIVFFLLPVPSGQQGEFSSRRTSSHAYNCAQVPVSQPSCRSNQPTAVATRNAPEIFVPQTVSGSPKAAPSSRAPLPALGYFWTSPASVSCSFARPKGSPIAPHLPAGASTRRSFPACGWHCCGGSTGPVNLLPTMSCSYLDVSNPT